ncbi:quercetin dioxygenase-like cupin family protein [Azospirillum lipoferum]|uniref:Cupin domain-containing protein n=1 Tax=Azospirillum lipoferum TaxID=193 RepID=A0A5A9GVU1_AZOLI|nr:MULTISPECIES: cupin domain-containing protein [Azospirillum]KAA0598556.1 cupin domain-containing protein [Azospirillum lipoferum]MCP1609436.1 quercetin dioxygenase-like cupin family protein [Azospirillum lipoferum]MDW5535255.1 cupin domain-containing protein [Azospirillum sp. NL1]
MPAEPNAEVITWSDLPAQATDGVERRSFPGMGASLKHIVIKAGTAAPRHDHPHEQFVIVVEGRVLLTCGAGPVDLRPGMVMRFDPGAWHSADFVEDTVLIEVNLTPAEYSVPSPPRGEG